MTIKKAVNNCLAILGYRLIRSPEPGLPTIHQMILKDHKYPFWITDQHTKRWWLKQEQDRSSEVEFLFEVCNQDSVILDVGAHHGYQSMLAASLAKKGQVHSFEANPVCALTLDANIGRNRLTNVFSNLLAIGAESKMIEIKGQSLDADSLDTWNVSMTTLDAYCKENKLANIDVLKIDVEGYEGEVLHGAEKVLESKPHINLELHLDDIQSFGWDVESVLSRLPMEDPDYDISFISREISWINRKKVAELDWSNQSGVLNIFFMNRAKIKPPKITNLANL